MKAFQVTFGIVVLFVAVGHSTAEENEGQKKLAQFGGECMKQEGASAADMQSVMKMMMPGSREGHCMVACIAEKMGFIKDGKFSSENAINMMSMAAKSNPQMEPMIEKFKAKMESCNPSNEDRCDLVVDIFSCFKP